MAYIDYYEFNRTYTRNSLMLFDKYVSTEGIDIDEERTHFMNHYIYPLSRFLDTLKSHKLINYLFNVSFMKLDIVNDEDFIDKEFNSTYFAAMYLAKFTLDAYNNNFKEETFGDLFRDIKHYRLGLLIGDGRKKSVFKRGVDNSIKKIKDYGLSLEIGSSENIASVKIRSSKIILKLKV